MQTLQLVLKCWKVPLGYAIHHPNILKFVWGCFSKLKKSLSIRACWESCNTGLWRGRAAPTHTENFHHPGMTSLNILAPAVLSQLSQWKSTFCWFPKRTIISNCIYGLTEAQKCSCSHHVRLRQCKLWKLINSIMRSLAQAEPHLRQERLAVILRRNMWQRITESLHSLKFFHTKVSTRWALVEAEIGECSWLWFMQLSALSKTS